MFLKLIFKTNQVTGERKRHYRLCESYRFENTGRHQPILHLGTVEDLPGTGLGRPISVRSIDTWYKMR